MRPHAALALGAWCLGDFVCAVGACGQIEAGWRQGAVVKQEWQVVVVALRLEVVNFVTWVARDEGTGCVDVMQEATVVLMERKMRVASVLLQAVV